MNGKVTVPTADEFVARFFAELLRHGYVDRAMATTRRTIKNLPRPDWWMPTLYMRLSAGRIWSVPRLTDRDKEPYEELSKSLQNETCTPVVGPSVLEPVWGMPRVVAREWAERRGFPLAPYRSDELASRCPVPGSQAQWGRQPNVRCTHVARDYGGPAQQTVAGSCWPRSTIWRACVPLDAWQDWYQKLGSGCVSNEFDPFRLLARLPVEIYLTATPDSLLADALRNADPPREPIVEYARWTDTLERKPRKFNEDDKYQSISRQRPLVFHLFGTLDEPDSMVLTEDDFFDYLIHVVKDTKNTAIPNQVRAAWSNNALILLGFDLDDWTFRALYRAIINEPGHSLRLRQGTLSAAVQLTPEEDRNLRPQSALEYLEQAFGSESISLSWSEPQDFLREVWQRLPPAFGGPS